MDKNKNRIIAAVLVGAMAMTVTGCGKIDGSQTAATVYEHDGNGCQLHVGRSGR